MPELYLKIVINKVLLRMASRDSRLNAGGLTTDEHNIKIGCKRDERYFTGTYKAGQLKNLGHEKLLLQEFNQ